MSLSDLGQGSAKLKYISRPCVLIGIEDTGILGISYSSSRLFSMWLRLRIFPLWHDKLEFKSGLASVVRRIPPLSAYRFNAKTLKELAAASSGINEPQLTNLAVRRPELLDTSRFQKRRVSTFEPVLVTKSHTGRANDWAGGSESFSVVSVCMDKERSVIHRMPSDQSFLVIKQKRYKRKKVIPERAQLAKDLSSPKLTALKFSDRPLFTANEFIDGDSGINLTRSYRLLKKNRTRDEAMSVSLSRRLLRTRRTLVIPAHVNLGLITNSYDVIHSWFLPGLGVKIDCVPGRSTHHTLYCDNVGFFYGQCAEICGRYHHHMPVRVCVLPFEHFLVW